VTTVLERFGFGSLVALHERPEHTCTHGVWALPFVVVPTAKATLPNAATSLTVTACRVGHCDDIDTQSTA